MITKTLQRKTINSGALVKYGLTDTRVKKASGFIEDIRTTGDYFRQPFLKLNSVDTDKLYRFNEWLFATVNRTVEDCVKVRPNVTVLEPDMEMTEARNKRIRTIKNFLRRPNNNKQSFRVLRKKFLTDIQVHSQGAYEKVKVDGILTELHDLQAANIEIRSDVHGNLIDNETYRIEMGSFRRSRGSKVVTFDKNQVIFATRYPVSGSHYGVKPIDNIANSVASDLLRASYNANFFVNGAEASGIMSFEGMSKVEMRKFRQYWDSKFRGAKNSHKIAAVNVPVKFVRMALTNQDMQFSEYGLELRSKIFAVYGMQPAILGISDNGSSAIKNKDEAVRCYKESALKPLLQMESEIYTEEIVFDGFGFDDIKISFDAIDDLDLETQSKIDEKDLMMGVTVINEVRGKRGFPDVPWGNTPIQMFPGGGQVDPDTGQLIPPSQQGGSNGTTITNNSNSRKCYNSRNNIIRTSVGDELESYFKGVKNYAKFLESNEFDFTKESFSDNFSEFGPIFYDSYFRSNFQAKCVCHAFFNEIKRLYELKHNIKSINLIFKIDSVIKELKSKRLFKDIENGIFY